MDISSIVNQMLILLILLIAGVIASKAGVMNADSNKHLTRIVLVLAQSAMVISSVMNVESGLSGLELLALIGVSFLSFALLFVVGLIFNIVFRVEKKDRGVFQYMCMFGNVAFMGFPLIKTMFGDTAVFYASLFNIPFSILTYSIGIVMISSSSGEKAKINFRQLINAPMISALISVIIFALKIPIPKPLAGAIETMGDMVVPSAMLIIGTSLGEMKIKEIFSDWRIYVLTIVKLIVAPILVWSVMSLFVTNTLILGIATALASMPIATNTTMLCIEYNGNESLASRGVFITTILSVITIPLMAYFLLI